MVLGFWWEAKFKLQINTLAKAEDCFLTGAFMIWEIVKNINLPTV
jgi:hypothetical protein